MIGGFIEISRPLNVLIAMISILFMGVLCLDTFLSLPLFLASLAGGMIGAAANTCNDFFDIEIDRINKPFRPLPQGKISVTQALIFAGSCSIIALLLTIFINKANFFIALLALALAFFYNARLKRTVIWGNLLVSVTTALAFIFGAVAVGSWRCALIPAGFAFLMHFGREILKDMEDVDGDRACQAKTLPIAHGLQAAKIVMSLVFAFLIAMTLMPFIFNIYGFYYLVLVVGGVDLILLYVIFKVWRKSDKDTLHRLSELLKFDMIIGLLALYMGRW